MLIHWGISAHTAEGEVLQFFKRRKQYNQNKTKLENTVSCNTDRGGQHPPWGEMSGSSSLESISARMRSRTQMARPLSAARRQHQTVKTDLQR